MKEASPATNQAAVSSADQKLLSLTIVREMTVEEERLVAEVETRELKEVKENNDSVQLKTKTPGSTNSTTWKFLNTKVWSLLSKLKSQHFLQKKTSSNNLQKMFLMNKWQL